MIRKFLWWQVLGNLAFFYAIDGLQFFVCADVLNVGHCLASRIYIEKSCSGIIMQKSRAVDIFWETFFIFLSILVRTIPYHLTKGLYCINISNNSESEEKSSPFTGKISSGKIASLVLAHNSCLFDWIKTKVNLIVVLAHLSMSLKSSTSITPITYDIDKRHTKITQASTIIAKSRLPSEDDLSICRNIGDRQSLKTLIDFKGVISQQLPKMPKDYITKILFNPKHQSVVARIAGTTIAGACFRCFQRKEFAELVFLAVSKRYRERGLGSRILDCLKQQLQSRNIKLLLTYADYSAVGFFQKQAFEYAEETPEVQWYGYIKAYEGGALMQCRIDSYCRYSQLRNIILQQKQALIAKIRLFFKGQISYSVYNQENIRKNLGKSKNAYQFDQCGLNLAKEYNIKATLRPFTQYSQLEYVPGVLESGWCCQLQRYLQATEETSVLLTRLYAVDTIRRLPLFKLILESQRNSVFQSPISWATIEKKIINSREYSDQDEFNADVRSLVGHLKRSENQDLRLLQDFEQNIQSILLALEEKRLLIQIDNAFKEDNASRNKKGHRI